MARQDLSATVMLYMMKTKEGSIAVRFRLRAAASSGLEMRSAAAAAKASAAVQHFKS